VDIKKAIITAAGKNKRTLPLQTLVDRDGVPRTALGIIIEEVLKAGVDEICVIISPGDQGAYAAAAGTHAKRLHFIEQKQPLGYGHAVYCGREFTQGKPFLLLVGDHLYVSGNKTGCAQQLVEAASSANCSVSAVQATHESKLPFYGTVGGKLVPGGHRLYEVEDLREKPTPTEAEQRLIVPGLRAGFYLCFFGMHVLTSAVMELLAEMISSSDGKASIQLTAALQKLLSRERYLACELVGRRYDIGVKYGLLTAQLALALDGQDRDEVLAGLVELLASKPK